MTNIHPHPFTGQTGVAKASRGALISGSDGSGIQRDISVDSSGYVNVNATITSAAVTNAGTFVVQENGAALTALQLLDDTVAVTASAIPSKGFAVSGTDGTNARVLKTDSSGELQVDVLTMPSVTVDSEFPAAAAASDNFANPTTTNVMAMGMVWDGSTWDRAKGDSTDGTLVNLGTNNDVTVTSGAITETNSAAIAASLSVLDDWDETNRAAVNTIAGQVGVQGASGVVTALTQRVVLATDVALPAGTNGIGKLTANSGVDIGDVDVTSIAAGDNNIGNVDIVTVPTDPFGANADAASATGSISAKLRFIAATGIPITGTVTVGSHAVTNAGTFVVQENGSALTALQLIDDPVFADDAAYTLSTSKGMVIAGVAVETDSTDPGSVSAEADAAAVRTDRNRRLLVNDCHPNFFELFENHTSAQTNNQLKSAPGANLSIYVTDLIISNGATAGTIYLVEDESGTPVQKSQTIYLAINGGAALHYKTPKKLTANKTLGFTSATMTTHSIEVHGYIAP